MKPSVVNTLAAVVAFLAFFAVPKPSQWSNPNELHEILEDRGDAGRIVAHDPGGAEVQQTTSLLGIVDDPII